MYNKEQKEKFIKDYLRNMVVSETAKTKINLMFDEGKVGILVGNNKLYLTGDEIIEFDLKTNKAKIVSELMTLTINI